MQPFEMEGDPVVAWVELALWMGVLPLVLIACIYWTCEIIMEYWNGWNS